MTSAPKRSGFAKVCAQAAKEFLQRHFCVRQACGDEADVQLNGRPRADGNSPCKHVLVSCVRLEQERFHNRRGNRKESHAHENREKDPLPKWPLQLHQKSNRQERHDEVCQNGEGTD